MNVPKTPKLRSIIMTGESVRAVIEGRKCETRRVIERYAARKQGGLRYYPGAWWSIHAGAMDRWVVTRPSALHEADGCPMESMKCHYGVKGDLLWVREVFYQGGYNQLEVDGDVRWHWLPHVNWYAADGPLPEQLKSTSSLRSPIHMPEWASRLKLRIQSVDAEPLNWMGEVDAEAEGCSSREEFRKGWDQINGKRGLGWDVNPWVWVIRFRFERIDSE